tara:strand:+ start:589 stop:1527 length:939 start_codon:yes stop_codon:yes gene_type:complete
MVLNGENIVARQIITKSNAMVEASYRLSLTEMQIILYGISLINPLQKEFPREYQVNIKRFAEMFNREHSKIYKEIKEAVTTKFWERDFRYKDQKGDIAAIRWLSKMVYNDNKGRIQIKFSEEVQPYLHELNKHFTTYCLDQIAQFKSIYSVRIYEYAIMNLNKSKKEKCQFEIEIKELKERLEIADKYKKFSHLKERVLERARKEINKHSDLNLSYNVIRDGRTPQKIKLTITTKLKKKPDTSYFQMPTTIIEIAKKIIRESNKDFDVYDLEQRFYKLTEELGTPKNPLGAFIDFVKKQCQKLEPELKAMLD